MRSYNASANTFEHGARTRRKPLRFGAARCDRDPGVGSDPAGWTDGDFGHGGILDDGMMLDVVSCVGGHFDNP